MSAALQTFTFEGRALRIVTGVDGEPRWVTKDVAEALGYRWHRGLTQHVPGEWRGVIPVDSPGGAQDMQVLTEHGLYFFLGRSDKPAALPMQKWIAGEVLPSIRKTGKYEVPGKARIGSGRIPAAAQIDRMIQLYGFEGTREILHRENPGLFAGLPGQLPKGPEPALQPALGMVEPLNLQIRVVEAAR